MNCRASTADNYARFVRIYLNPHLGGTMLAAVNPTLIQSMLAHLERDGKSLRVRQLAYDVLRRALRQAVKLGLIPKSPTDRVNRPAGPKREIRALTLEEACKLLEAAKGDRLEALYVLAVTTGLRQGELLGLEWQDIDLKLAVLTVRRQLNEVSGKLSYGPPKTHAGRRHVALPDLAVTVLREHRKAMLAEGHPGPAVFCDSEGGPIRKSSLIRRPFEPLLIRAGMLPPKPKKKPGRRPKGAAPEPPKEKPAKKPARANRIRFHDLRHTSATLLLALGEHPKVVQERLGHARLAATMDVYSHILPNRQQEAAAKLDRAFGQDYQGRAAQVRQGRPLGKLGSGGRQSFGLVAHRFAPRPVVAHIHRKMIDKLVWV